MPVRGDRYPVLWQRDGGTVLPSSGGGLPGQPGLPGTAAEGPGGGRVLCRCPSGRSGSPHRSGGGRPGQPKQQFGSGVSPRPALTAQQYQARHHPPGGGGPQQLGPDGGGLPLRHPAAAAPGLGGVGGRPALCPRRESGYFTVCPSGRSKTGGAGGAGLPAEDDSGGLGQTARRRSRGGPAPAIRAGGAAVSEPGRFLCSGQYGWS